MGCGDLVRHVEDMVDNLLTHVQILTLLSPCGHGGSPAVTPGHEAKPHVCSGGLVGARKLARKPSLGKFPFQKKIVLNIIIILNCNKYIYFLFYFKVVY